MVAPALSSSLAVFEITSHVAVGEQWAQQKKQWWGPASAPGHTAAPVTCAIEYFQLSAAHGAWRKFQLGQENFREAARLQPDRARLREFYPGLTATLSGPGSGPLPYEVLTDDLVSVKLAQHATPFTLRPALHDLYEATHQSLMAHYQRTGIAYEPALLARARDWADHTLTLAPVEYTMAAATNLLADLDLARALQQTILLEDRAEPARTLREYDLSLSPEPGRYPPLRHSALANPIGVAGLALTADNKLILTHRSRNVSTYADQLGPSASGYVTWHDVQTQPTASLNTVLTTALQREIAEELHLDLAHEITAWQPLGLCREFYRAGMPQAFYAFRLSLTAEQLASRLRDARDFREGVGLLAIAVNWAALMPVIATLVQTQHIHQHPLGLEAQGLLTAFARQAENSWFAPA